MTRGDVARAAANEARQRDLALARTVTQLCVLQAGLSVSRGKRTKLPLAMVADWEARVKAMTDEVYTAIKESEE